jgi:alpha-tubulin suppressor-like RCC1 family protein
MLKFRHLVIGLLFLLPLVLTVSRAGKDQEALISISVGKGYACGLISSGNAYCWGWNEYGQLGNKSTTDSSISVAMSAPKGENTLSFSNLSTGLRHACGLTLGGKAYCWGWNKFGQLGNKSTTDSIIPIAIADSVAEGNLAFSSISAGDYHTCGIVSSGKIYCWGRNEDGQLGNGKLINSNIPVLVVTPQHEPSLSFSSVAVSGNHTCAVSTDGKAYCWGYNSDGQLGNNSNISTNVPVAVVDLINTNKLIFSKITSGYSSTCALTLQGRVYCWGKNDNGELGNNGKANSTIPVAVAAPKSEEILTFLAIG